MPQKGTSSENTINIIYRFYKTLIQPNCISTYKNLCMITHVHATMHVIYVRVAFQNIHYIEQ